MEKRKTKLPKETVQFLDNNPERRVFYPPYSDMKWEELVATEVGKVFLAGKVASKKKSGERRPYY